MHEISVPAGSAKRHAPATLRNREPIRDVLATVLPERARVLEVGAGTGEHAVFFARSFPARTWQPTEADPEGIGSIAAYGAEACLPNLRPPVFLDVSVWPWPALADQPFDAVLSVNMIHIAPWSACLGLIAGAATVVGEGGLLVFYGPFMVDGRHTAPSNAAFDQTLRATDHRFGVRDSVDVAREARANGFALTQRVAMPANNVMLVFARR
jgi:Protein of unknown function (DUF938)